ncbi:MAG: cytochrome c family protein [Thermodesulfobacterium sp.]|nr:cytochrome c family protein [Thermodesulfobacterium sp.]
MKLNNKLFYIFAGCLFLLIFVSFYLFSDNITFAKSENSCLRCHSVKRLPKVLSNGEKMDLYVDREKFSNSVHGDFSCTDCHIDIDTSTHPRPIKIESKLAYAKEVSQNCVNCHMEDSLSPIHQGILKEGKLSCAECHGSHYITPVSQLKEKSEKCLRCHSVKRLPKVLSNGEKMDLYVDREKFSNSVHGKLGCLFCHKDIDPLAHPKPVIIESKRAYGNKIFKNCLNCHPLNSISPIHKDFLKEDRMVCLGCHGNHYIKSKAQWSKETNKCLRCHSVKRLPKVLSNGEKMDLYVDKEKFKKTVHTDVGCWACHQGINFSNHPRPLFIESKRKFTEKVTSGCFRCHPKNVLSVHPGHAKIINISTFVCVDCHGYHKNQSVKAWKKKVSTNEYCMSCHKFNIVKKLPSKEKLSMKVDLSQIEHSVHAGFSCTDCHMDFSKDEHPVYKFKNRKEYTVNFSRNICQTCHTDEELKENPVHYSISKTASCVECHGAHNVKPAKLPAGVSEKEYCMSCHSGALTKKMENGEKLSLKVDESQILHSVHGKLKCSDCHKGYSTKSHPIRSFKSISEYRSKAQEVCRNCHAKEVSEYNSSIHKALVSKGYPEAPDCLSCHGYHGVSRISTDDIARYNLCSSCHSKESDSFKESIHYKAFEEGKEGAPVCSSCHGAHKVLPTSVANLKDSCISCHSEAKSYHNKWLYNPPFKLESFVDVHFNGSSCSACHASGEKAVILTLATSESKVLTLEELSKLTNWDIEEIRAKLDVNGDNLVQKEELWEFLGDLKGLVKVELKGRLDMVNKNDAHKIISKKKAIKDCAFCHDPKAQFVGRLEINKEEGKAERISVERSAVNSAYAIPNIKDFYVLGLTKIDVLDTLFVIALIAGIGVVAGHIFLRIVTIPVRRKKKEGQ